MKVTEHTLANGQAIRLQTVTGTVLGASKSMTTSIHQDAPEVLNRYTVLPGQIHSKTHTRHEVWLRLDDEREHSAQLSDLPVTVREGQVVSLVYGGPVWSGTTWLFGARNHTTGKVVCEVESLKETLRQWKLSIGVGRSLLTWTLSGALFPALVAASAAPSDRLGMAILFGGLGAVVSFFLWAFFGTLFGVGQRAMALTQEINDLGRQALMDEKAVRRSALDDGPPIAQVVHSA